MASQTAFASSSKEEERAALVSLHDRIMQKFDAACAEAKTAREQPMHYKKCVSRMDSLFTAATEVRAMMAELSPLSWETVQS